MIWSLPVLDGEHRFCYFFQIALIFKQLYI